MAAIVVETRRATIADVYALAAKLRAGDRAEILAMGRDPRRALRFAYRVSLVPPRVATVDGLRTTSTSSLPGACPIAAATSSGVGR